MFSKNPRIIDLELLAVVKSLPCVACGRKPGGDAHHVSSRGAMGDDLPSNLMALCRREHMLVHHIGWSKFIECYPSVKEWLIKNNRTDILERLGRVNPE